MTLNEEWNKEFNKNDTKEQKKEMPTEFIQKTSNILEYPEFKLVESAIIAGIPKFLISEGKDIKIQKSIELENKILKPFESTMYMNKPYSFDSDEQAQEYINKAKIETLDILYLKVKSIWKKYIDADDFHIVICAAEL